MAQVSSSRGMLSAGITSHSVCSLLATLVIVFNNLFLLQQAKKAKQDKGTVMESLKVKGSQHAQAQ